MSVLLGLYSVSIIRVDRGIGAVILEPDGVSVLPLIWGVGLFCFELRRVFHLDLLVVEHDCWLLIFHYFRQDIVIVNGLYVSALLYLPEIVHCFFQFLQLLHTTTWFVHIPLLMHILSLLLRVVRWLDTVFILNCLFNGSWGLERLLIGLFFVGVSAAYPIRCIVLLQG